MRPGRTHYEVLGVARNATPEEIKRQYRRLAKRYHPDVAATENAAAAQHVFTQIADAYAILSDTSKRATYDLELSLQDIERQDAARAQAAHTAPRNGSWQRPAGGAAPRARTRPDLSGPFARAQMDFSRGRLREALATCQDIVRQDRRFARAYSLMGDIYRAQGNADEAIRMYTMSVQLDPGATADMEKLDRLARENRAAGIAAPPLSASKRALAVIGWSIVAGLVALPALSRNDMAPPFLWQWTDTLLLGMVGAALLAGFLLTVTCFIGRLDEDFLFASVRTGRGPVPIGILILLVSLLFFPLALLFYLITAVMEGAASRQMLCILGVSSAALLLFAAVQPTAAVQTLLFGGNIVFPCMILGGFAGGFFRDPW